MNYRRRRRNNNNRNFQQQQQQPREESYLIETIEVLLKECRRLQKRITELERGGNAVSPVMGDLDDEVDGYDDTLGDIWRTAHNVKLPNTKAHRGNRNGKAAEIEIKAATRRNVNDLYREARQKHQTAVQLEQEKAVDEFLDGAEEKQPEVAISEQKKKFYVERAKALTATKG